MRKIPGWFIKLINVILILIPYAYSWFRFYEQRTMIFNLRQVSVLMLVMYTIVFLYLAQKLDGFRWSIRHIGELIFGQSIAIGVTDFTAALCIWMLSPDFPNLIPGIICFGIQCVIIACYVPVCHKILYASNPPQKVVVIYDVRQGIEKLVSSYGLDKRYEVQASYAIEEILKKTDEETEKSLIEKLSGIEDVFMCGVHTHDRNIILKYCIYNHINVFMIPRVGDMVMSAAERMHMLNLPFLRVNRYDPPKYFVVIKRLFDIVVSGILLILTSPVMAIVALLVRRDGGPALYKQVRLTKDGRKFKIIKFRSMRVDAERYTGAVWSAGDNDPRITRTGKFIRSCRLDELPQLWNILVGDMSIVGPRPERPELAEEFEKEMPEFALRLQCKAGLTGYAQVYGKYNTTPYDKTLMDLMYIAHPSLLEDLTIMLATVRILFSKESTEGIGAGQQLSMRYVKNQHVEKIDDSQAQDYKRA